MSSVSVLEGRAVGETVWVAMTSVQAGGGANGRITAQSWVHDAVVFNVEHGLVQLGGNSPPRMVYRYCETIHSTAEEAWQEVAAQHRRSAQVLLDEAAECDRKAGVARAVEAA